MMKSGDVLSKSPSTVRAGFEIEQGNRREKLILVKDRVVIGSVESSDIRLDGVLVSPIHAIIEIKWGADPSACSARLIDLASQTGVTVNGAAVVSGEIRSGDQIRIGDALIRFAFTASHPVQKTLPDQSLLLVDPSTVSPIFDYRPAVKEALEVVCSWNGVILNVRNFFEEVQVLLGGDLDADFQIPKGLYGADGAVLAFKQGQDWKLKLSPEMKGVLYTGGRLVPIPDFVIVNEERDAAVVSLGDGDFVKLQIGALSFHLSRTVSPPVLVKRGEVGSDPFLVRMLLVSLSITILSLFAVSRLEVPQSEPPVFSETVATILYHPEKYTSRPAVPEQQTPLENPVEAVPAKENKVVQSEAAAKTKKKASEGMAKEGAGARALGREGRRGSKTAPKADQGKTAAKRTSPVPGKDRGGTNSRSQDEGNVQLLKGASNRILDLLGGSGQKLGASGSKLEGFGGFSNRGNGGAALQGSGKGGGGRADTLLGGQGNQGRAGGRVGTGLGAEGTGTGIVGGKTRLNLNVGGGNETVVIGAIDRDAIDAAIRAHRDEFRYCYEHEVNSGHPSLSGKIVTAFVIGGSGRSSQQSIASSSMSNANVERCVLGVISRIQFPLPGGGVPVSIKYPFAFTNASK